jgi:hypothetical protein
VIAYLVMSYTRPELVHRLLARLRGGVVAVHHDPRFCALGDIDALLVPPQPVEWGHGSQLAAILRSLRVLTEHDWDWLVLLSGQDYPVRPVATIEAELLAAPVDAFIRHKPIPPRVLKRGAVDEFARRYTYRWRRLGGPAPPGAASPPTTTAAAPPAAATPPATATPPDAAAPPTTTAAAPPAATAPPATPARERCAAALARLDPLVQVRRLPSGAYVGFPAAAPLPVFHGSDWFSLSRRAVEAVLAAPAEVVDHFLHTIIPTEAFVHTVLANSGLRLANDHRRYAVFDPPSAASPRVFGLGDVDEVLASGADFARKFEDVAVLDAIDARVHS